MAFYCPDASMDQRLAALVQRLADERGPELSGAVSITWLRYGGSLLDPDRDRSEPGELSSDAVPGAAAAVSGASWQGTCLRDPGDLVQLPYLIASERWLQRGLLEDEPELCSAQLAMIRHGSHDATSYVVDRLSGTTSGPALADSGRKAWEAQRLLVNGWLASLGWSELEGCQAAQKTWQDGPYGRERQFIGAAQQNANRFSSDGLARLLDGVLAGTLISPPACQRMRSLLAAEVLQGSQAADLPAGLASVLPAASAGWRRFWGRGGRDPRAMELALYGEAVGQAPTLLVVLAEHRAVDDGEGLLAGIVAELFGAAAAAD